MANINDLIAEQELTELAGRVRASVWVPAHLWEDALQVAALEICRVAADGNSWKPEVQTAKRDFGAWAYIKARFALLSWVRKETTHSSNLPLLESDAFTAPAEMDAVVIRSDLAGVLRSLEPLDREILLMDALGYRRADISHRFRMNSQQLTARIAEVRCAVRTLLADHLPAIHVENESK